MLSKVSILFFLIAQAFCQGFIDSSLQKALGNGERKDVMVSFSRGTQDVLDGMDSQSFADRTSKINYMVSALKVNRDVSQSGVLSALRVQGVQHESFWINNEISVKNVDSRVVSALAGMQGVSGVREDSKIPLMKTIQTKQNNQNAWGVTKIYSEYTWENFNNGTGIRAGIIDTGARHTHVALRDTYVGAAEYGWFDGYFSREAKRQTPQDLQGHGTHVTGSVCGTQGIGVAPGARWMACRGCYSISCQESALVSCGQFMTCPTNPRGDNPDCKKAPHVVNNSWGGGTTGTFYDNVINAWLKANIIPVFANGNDGPDCDTAGYPGNSKDVIGVGATNRSDEIASFSSKGRSQKHPEAIKPDVSAPGVDIRSAHFRSDTEYQTMSGTSMASPHLTGVITLILGQRRDQTHTIERVRQILSKAVERSEFASSKRSCGGVDERNFPNHAYGSGRVNAYYAAYYAQEEGIDKLTNN